MTKFKAKSIITEFWKPDSNYINIMIESLAGKIADGDFIVVSEKAIATSINNIINESTVNPNLSARIIGRIWMRIVWGYFLGFLCHFNPKFIANLRNYPLEDGARHKQVCLQYMGFLEVLTPRYFAIPSSVGYLFAASFSSS